MIVLHNNTQLFLDQISRQYLKSIECGTNLSIQRVKITDKITITGKIPAFVICIHRHNIIHSFIHSLYFLIFASQTKIPVITQWYI